MKYVNIKKLDLNLDKLTTESMSVYDCLLKHFSGLTGTYNNEKGDTPFSSNVFDHYNFFTFVREESRILFSEIQKFFRELEPNLDTQYVMQAWVNIIKKDQNLDRHCHWMPEFRSWHGYYVVNAEPSVTTYWLPDGQIERIDNKNNTLVISKSDGDTHATTKWNDPDNFRITIAFDILPTNTLARVVPGSYNHWIPI